MVETQLSFIFIFFFFRFRVVCFAIRSTRDYQIITNIDRAFIYSAESFQIFKVIRHQSKTNIWKIERQTTFLRRAKCNVKYIFIYLSLPAIVSSTFKMKQYTIDLFLLFYYIDAVSA